MTEVTSLNYRKALKTSASVLLIFIEGATSRISPCFFSLNHSTFSKFSLNYFPNRSIPEGVAATCPTYNLHWGHFV